MNSNTRKIVAGLLSLAMVFTLVVGVATTASAQTTATFTSNLTVGSRGTQVSQLQAILNAQGYLAVSPTGYFGSLTKAALAKFQAANGISPAAGYFGPITRAFINGGGVPTTPGASIPGCQAGYVFSPVTGQRCDSVSSPVAGTGTDGSLTASLSTAVGDTTIKKGETKDMVAVKLQATAGDVTVSRFDVRLDKRPWLYFSQLQLKDTTGKVIATKSVAMASEATEITAGSDYLVRFEGLTEVVKPGTDRTLVVAGTVQANTDKLTSNVSVIVSVPNASIRTINGKGYTDSLGLGTVATAGTSGRTVTLSSTGSTGNIVVKASASQTAHIETTSTNGQTSGVVLGSYDFKSENKGGTINTLKFAILNSIDGGTLTESASSTVFKSLRLVDGSNTYYVSAYNTASTSTFSNLNISLPVGEWKTLKLVADIADQDDFTNGLMASTSITANTTNVVGLDSDYNSLTVTSATPTTPNITFLSSGASVSGISVSKTPVDNGSSATVKYGVQFQYTLNNTGSSDLYVSKTPGVALATSTTASSSSLTLASASGSNANDTSAHWVVAAGSSRTFTFDGVMDNTNGTSGAKEFKITKVYFDDDSTGLQEYNVDFGLDALRVTATF